MWATYPPVMCQSQFPPNFSEKKTLRIKIRYLALKETYFWFPQGMIVFPGGVRQKWNFRRGGGVHFVGRFWKIQRGGGVIGKIPSVGGGEWIFSGTTHFMWEKKHFLLYSSHSQWKITLIKSFNLSIMLYSAVHFDTHKVAICSLSLHQGNTENCKNLEQKFIFQLGTLNLHGINDRFSFNNPLINTLNPKSLYLLWW